MSPQSAYIRYRASSELNQLVKEYISSMEQEIPEPKLEVLLSLMDLFVKESVNTFVLNPAIHINLKPSYLKMIHSLCGMVEKSSMMLVSKVAKSMSVEDHMNAAQYMKQVRLEYQKNGEEVADIIFPLQSDFAELGWGTREKMNAGLAHHPDVLDDGIRFLHGVIDVANLWVFEKPVDILNLGTIMRKLAFGTVSTVKKATHSLINKLVPKLSEPQIQASSDYFAFIVGPGPYSDEYGPIPQPFLDFWARRQS